MRLWVSESREGSVGGSSNAGVLPASKASSAAKTMPPHIPREAIGPNVLASHELGNGKPCREGLKAVSMYMAP